MRATTTSGHLLVICPWPLPPLQVDPGFCYEFVFHSAAAPGVFFQIGGDLWASIHCSMARIAEYQVSDHHFLWGFVSSNHMPITPSPIPYTITITHHATGELAVHRVSLSSLVFSSCLLPPFQHRANVAASDACRLALQHVPTLADPAGLAANTDALAAMLKAVDGMSLDDRAAVQHALRHAQRAERRLEGKRRRLRGMVTDNHRQVARIVSALVGDQGALIMPKLRSSDMLRGTNSQGSATRQAFASFRPLKLHDCTKEELENRGQRAICGRAACEHGSTSRCMVMNCRQWGRANGRIFNCDHCGARVLRDGQGKI